jgi:hypothetical protein
LGNSKKLLCEKERGMLIKEVEVKTIPPVSPEKARLDALKRQKQNITKTIKTTKAQEKITQGQKQLTQALAVKK